MTLTKCRRQILTTLRATGEIRQGDLAARLDRDQANVSRDLSILLAQRLVSRRYEGLYAFYSLTAAGVKATDG